MVNALTVERVSVALHGKTVVKEIAFNGQSGQLIGLVGANGVGKSTLIRAIAGLVPVTAGRILWQGQPITSFSPPARAKAIAYMPQGQSIHWRISVRHLVALGRLPHLGALSRVLESDSAAIERAMDSADVLDLADRSATELSGGERSRVLLARALAVEAPVLLADEPTAALDPYHQLHTLELLRRLADTGTLVIAVLHDLSQAARACDRILLLKDGRLIADGPPRQTLTGESLAQAFNIEARFSDVEQQSFIVPWQRLS